MELIVSSLLCEVCYNVRPEAAIQHFVKSLVTHEADWYHYITWLIKWPNINELLIHIGQESHTKIWSKYWLSLSPKVKLHYRIKSPRWPTVEWGATPSSCTWWRHCSHYRINWLKLNPNQTGQLVPARPVWVLCCHVTREAFCAAGNVQSHLTWLNGTTHWDYKGRAVLPQLRAIVLLLTDKHWNISFYDITWARCIRKS